MKRILIIDDEPDVAGAMKQLVEKAGYNADVCMDPLSAIEIAEGYGLILLDIIMPQLSGEEFIRQLKSAGLSLPVIVVSAVSLPSKKRKELQGIHPEISFITKTHMDTDLLPEVKKRLAN